MPKKQKLKLANPESIRLLYHMMNDVHRLFVHFKLPYWIDGGSILGAIRNKGIIPWDDDLDIGILKKDEKRFLRLRSVLGRAGYSITPVWFGYKIFYSDRPFIDGFDYSFPFMDVFIFDLIDGEYKLAQDEAREMWPKESWPKDDLFPLKPYRLGEIIAMGPAKHLDYLNKMYGNDWNEIAYRQWDHEAEESVKRIRVTLTPEMRGPAQPTAVVQNPAVDEIIAEDQAKHVKKSTRVSRKGRSVSRKSRSVSRKGRSASRKSTSRKGRSVSRKSRSASRKGRSASRKSRSTSRKGRSASRKRRSASRKSSSRYRKRSSSRKGRSSARKSASRKGRSNSSSRKRSLFRESGSIYQKAILKALEKDSPLSLREVMRNQGIPDSKKTYVIDAIKALLKNGKVRVVEHTTRITQYMDNKYALN
jgi:hypothetical protein